MSVTAALTLSAAWEAMNYRRHCVLEKQFLRPGIFFDAPLADPRIRESGNGLFVGESVDVGRVSESGTWQAVGSPECSMHAFKRGR